MTELLFDNRIIGTTKWTKNTIRRCPRYIGTVWFSLLATN